MSDQPDAGPSLSSSIPVLAVDSYQTAKAFYVEKLGFSVVEEGGDPAGFGIFRQGRATVFLDSWTERPPPQKCWSAYFHVVDLAGVRTWFTSRGAEPTTIRDTGYGMMEFDIVDPDGHILCFGEDQKDFEDRAAIEDGKDQER